MKLRRQKVVKDKSQKEHLLVVRALCDLLLDEQVETSTYREPQIPSQVIDHNQ